MKNKLTKLLNEDKKIIEKIKEKKNIYIVEINGKGCSDISTYFNIISEKFKFPIKTKSYDSYNSWMKDLSWILNEKIVIIIYNYDSFLKNDIKAKKIIEKLFIDSILPWWDTEVCKYVLCGKKKSFNVYCIE
jgi:hypothetical protein